MATSSRTTGNEPISGIDPGGTRSTRPGKPASDGEKVAEQPVRSGDRNDGTHSEIGGANAPRPKGGRPA